LNAVFALFQKRFKVGVDSLGLIVICGPTATGKSSLAIELAKEFNSTIIAADSRTCYREFDIGTAKPTAEEQSIIPHYLIDTCAPTQPLTVADYQTHVQDLITQFHHQSVTPLLVGGTGLYIRSITRGLKIPRVPPQPDLRLQLQSFDQSYLYNLLRHVDPASTQRIHAHDRVRTMRALEVFYVTGEPLSAQQGENPPNYPIMQIGLDCFEPDNLTERIQHRTRQMIEAGFVEEVETLSRKYGFDLPLLNTLGYQEIKHYLHGESTLEEAEISIVIHTRQFAKRQRTWFRAIPEITWFDANQAQLSQSILSKLSTG
jgi:tRNA dimethylallyltransferase